MSNNLKGFAENVLFALNILLIFLLAFESQIILPLWLQPIGRIHPMLLHFPIAILFLAMVLEFFRFRPEYHDQKFYQSFTANLLLFGALSSAVTAIMGLFLSLEAGYSGNVLQWHKWFGAGIVFLSSFIYMCRHTVWYKSQIAKAGAIVSMLTLILAGHFGATLTHGDNFILAPITNTEAPVPLNEAIVFQHVVKPIFDNKCSSCHNPGKAKGELILETSETILKGGKTGKLFEAGKPDQSLLIERIHLPIDDEEHMPPSGKAQLSPQEIALLDLWIKGGADFNTKVTSISLYDSLRVMATALLHPEGLEEDQYEFAAADAELVQKLNTDYRFVSSLAKESPALVVNLFNPNAYTPEALGELGAVETQIVSLGLNKIPISDAELKNIGQFENLRKLNLNFTAITGKGLVELASLKHLKSLSLSGTKVDYQHLQQQLKEFKSLTTLVVWNTGLNESEVQQLQNDNKHIQIIAGYTDDGSNPLKLNIPQLKNSSNIFSDSLPLQLGHPIEGVEIRFTTDGSEPDSINSLIFTNETLLTGYTLIKAKAYKDKWYGSDVATFDLYKSKYKPDSVILLSPFNRVHPANGANTFFDKEQGTFNANSPAWANNWAGFLNNDMEVLLTYKEPVTLSSVALNMLIEPETIIFPPASIEIWGGASESQLQLITTMNPDQPEGISKPFIQLVDCKFDPQRISYLKIVAKPLKKLPSWHRNKGRSALLLVDEMFVN
ncbi:MAG: c-type cytochrome domain-containing protein [Anditalea sp.]